jgi:serine protease Do
MTLLQELSDSTRTVNDAVVPVVVRIGRAGGRGCGVVVGPGQVLTNAHNIRGQETTVTFADGRTTRGTVSGADVDGDVAVISVDTGDTPALEWAPDAPDLGNVVFAVTLGPGGATRTTWGSVSATEQAFRGPRGRRISGSVEHTAPMSRGSSGSPVVDAQGRLVGINTNRLDQGFYLAVPADSALRGRVDQLAKGATPGSRHLGIAVAPPHVAKKLRRSVGLAEHDGLLIRGVEEDSPADAAGIREGDLIIRAGENDIVTMDDLYEALDEVGAGDTITLTILRGADELTKIAQIA